MPNSSVDVPVDDWSSTEFRIDAGKLSLSWASGEVRRTMPEWHPLCSGYQDVRIVLRAISMAKAFLINNYDLGRLGGPGFKLGYRLSPFIEYLWRLDYYSVGDEYWLEFSNGMRLWHNYNTQPDGLRLVVGSYGPFERFKFEYGDWFVIIEYYGRGEFFLEFSDYDDNSIIYNYHTASDFRRQGTRPLDGARHFPRRNCTV